MPPRRAADKGSRQQKENVDNEDQDAHKNGEKRQGEKPYTCTGKFHKDFAELCLKRSIAAPPQILPVPQPPVPIVVQHHQQESKPEKSKKDKNAAKDKERNEPQPQQTDEQEEAKEPEFKTFAVRDNIEYGRPTIFVEMENHDKQDTVVEMKIRGFKMDTVMIEIFQQCWAALEKLTVVYLWNVGLTSQTMEQFANALTSCPNIKTLLVEGNPLPEETHYQLIEAETSITRLMLRHNSITDKGAALIGHALGNPRKTNQKLYELHLDNNMINDEGFVKLIKGLRLNRTLLALSVAGNFVSDEGIAKLSETIARFPLTHEEIVERRRLFGEQRSAERQKSRGDSRNNRPNSGARPPQREKASRISGRQKKDGKEKEKDDHQPKKGGRKEADKDKGAARKGAVDKEKTQASKAATQAPPSNRGKPKDKRGTSAESQTPEKLEAVNPLLEDAEQGNNGEIWIPGNRVLAMLNLANNRVTNYGVAELLKGFQYQMTAVELFKTGTGIMWCNLKNNAISYEDEAYSTFQKHLDNRDPLQRKRPPSVPSATPVTTDPPKSESKSDRKGRSIEK